MAHHEDEQPVLAGRPKGVPFWGIGMAIPAFLVLLVAHRYGYIADVPLVLILGELLLTLAVMALFTSKFPPGTPAARPRLHMCLQIVLIGIIVYTLGWGSLLAVGFIFPATNIMSSDGSKYGPWAMGCIAMTVAAGESAVRIGVVKSLVPGSIGYGLALLEVAGTCAVVWILTFNQREKEQVERSVVESEQRFRALVQNAPDIIIVVAVDGTISYVSPAFQIAFGYSAAESLGMEAHLLMAGEDVARLRELAEASAGDATPRRLELRLLHHDGSWRWCEVTLTDMFDVPGVNGWVANVRDITERKAISDQLAFEAAHDVMTGLVNRATFTERVTETLLESSGPTAVLFIDLDHFKIVNDGLGHAAGDELLVKVSQRLRSVIRPGDVVARFGGDEFVVLCDRINGDDAVQQLAQRLLFALAQPLTVAGNEVFVTASIGIALSHEGNTADSLLRQADAAMYQAKHEGRSRTVVFRPDRHGSAAAVLRTGSDLHRALERDELAVHYQPIVDLRIGRVTGFEALVRWNHPERGLLLPGEFLGLAEESGLIVPIGTWVLETACRQTARWELVRHTSAGARPLLINVNLAARQLVDPALARTVAYVIRETGIAPSALCLELTEHTLMYDTTST
ncbi:MAG TPA: diguanylate cyclase, partial [Acidimicrobiales bacterium]|nr:diguanylate cyclase [Acidimicrobiales bacterium]